MRTQSQALTINVSGLRISYDDLGQGKSALLLMPGWCGSRQVFNQLAEECSRYRRTLVLDWRGHGESDASIDDFGSNELVEDALAVIEASGVEHVVPVALSHAGFIAIELRRRLMERVPKLVLLDWIMLDPPPPFLGALQGLQSSTDWQPTRDALFSMWLHGLEIPELTSYVREDMGSFDAEMWARAGREISAAYAASGNPLAELARLDTPVPVMHMYAQPDDPGYLVAQQSFSEANPWFHVQKLDAHSHFPMLEIPSRMATLIEQFVA